MEFSHVGGVTWFICRFRQTLPEAFHHSLKCRQIVSGKNDPPGSLSQHITSRVENKGTCKRSRHKCKAVKLPPNQHKMFFFFFWSCGERSRDRGSSEVREASWPVLPLGGRVKGKVGRVPSRSRVWVDKTTGKQTECRVLDQRNSLTHSKIHYYTVEFWWEVLGGRVCFH